MLLHTEIGFDILRANIRNDSERSLATCDGDVRCLGRKETCDRCAAGEISPNKISAGELKTAALMGRRFCFFRAFLVFWKRKNIMNSDRRNDSQLESCLTELRGICEHLGPAPRRWHRIEARVSYWWSRNNAGEAFFVLAVWIGLFVGFPLLLSMCDTKKSPEPKSSRSDTVAEYTVTDDADDGQESEEVDDQ